MSPPSLVVKPPDAKKKPSRTKPPCLDKDWRYVHDKIVSVAKSRGILLPKALKVSYSRVGGKIEGEVEPRLRGLAVEEIVKTAFAGCEIGSGELSSGTRSLSF